MDILVWILCGILSVLILYSSIEHHWYDTFHESFWWSQEGKYVLLLLIVSSSAFIALGLISLFIVYIIIKALGYPIKIWFQIPKENNERNNH